MYNKKELLEKKDVVCFAFPAWKGDYAKSTVILMSLLAKEFRVIYIDYEYTWKDVMAGLLKFKEIPLLRILGFKNRIRVENTSYNTEVLVFSPPPVFPVNWINHESLYHWGLRINSYILLKSLKKHFRKLKVAQPVVINAFNPFYGLYTEGKLQEKATFYYCYDQIKAAQWAKKHGGKIEKRFMQKVTGVITSSTALKREKEQVNPNCFVVNNGVDFDLFNQCYDPIAENNTVPVVGFVGSMDDRLNYPLIEEVVQNCPDIHFKFTGRVADQKYLQKLLKFPNFELAKPVDYQEIPEIVRGFDIGIIPFIQNEFTKNIYPLKINEYLALGKAVVMTNFADLSEFASVVKTANSAEEFILAIRKSLKENQDEMKNKRIETAKNNSWHNRAEEFAEIIRTR